MGGLPSRRRARREAREGKGDIRRRALTIATIVLLTTPTIASAHGAWWWHHSAWWRSHHPWTQTWKQDALCIHSHEGSWSDPNPLYYGGMQMDLSFQAAYGPWMLHHYGTADHWPRSGQLYASYKAWLVRGWTPWPLTRLMCGV